MELGIKIAMRNWLKKFVISNHLISFRYNRDRFHISLKADIKKVLYKLKTYRNSVEQGRGKDDSLQKKITACLVQNLFNSSENIPLKWQSTILINRELETLQE